MYLCICILGGGVDVVVDPLYRPLVQGCDELLVTSGGGETKPRTKSLFRTVAKTNFGPILTKNMIHKAKFEILNFPPYTIY